MAKLRVCLDLELRLDAKTARLLELAGISSLDLVKRLLERALSLDDVLRLARVASIEALELEEAGQEGVSPQNPVPVVDRGELDWKKLVELYIEGRHDEIDRILANKGIYAPYRVRHCIEVLAYAAKNRGAVLYSDAGARFYIVERGGEVYVIRLHPRECSYARRERNDVEGIKTAIRRLCSRLADDAISKILPRLRRGSDVLVVDEEKIRKARERLILEREAWLNR